MKDRIDNKKRMKEWKREIINENRIKEIMKNEKENEWKEKRMNERKKN